MGYVTVFCSCASYLWPPSSLILPFSNYLSLLFLPPPPAAPWTMVRRWSSERERLRWLPSLSHSSLNEPCSSGVHMLHIYMGTFNDFLDTSREAPRKEATGAKVFGDAELCLPWLSGCFEESGCQQMPWEWHLLWKLEYAKSERRPGL